MTDRRGITGVVCGEGNGSLKAMCPMRLVLLAGVALFFNSPAGSASPRALPAGQRPDDFRLQAPKDLDGYFPFQPPESKEAWDRRASQVRQRILVSQGLWPMPTKTDLKAQIYGRIDRGDYTVEKVHFESAPGFFVTGNLYRPKKAAGAKAPGVLFAHGHWADARLSQATDPELRNEIATGQEARAASNPCVSNWPAWAVWCGSGICWATPIPNSFPANWFTASPSNGPR
jgi:hypothetical protein